MLLLDKYRLNLSLPIPLKIRLCKMPLLSSGCSHLFQLRQIQYIIWNYYRLDIYILVEEMSVEGPCTPSSVSILWLETCWWLRRERRTWCSTRFLVLCWGLPLCPLLTPLEGSMRMLRLVIGTVFDVYTSICQDKSLWVPFLYSAYGLMKMHVICYKKYTADTWFLLLFLLLLWWLFLFFLG